MKRAPSGLHVTPFDQIKAAFHSLGKALSHLDEMVLAILVFSVLNFMLLLFVLAYLITHFK